jgi:hypothetical protein
MGTTFDKFASSTSLNETHQFIGYSSTNPGGEKKCTLSVLRNSLIGAGALSTIMNSNLASNQCLMTDNNGKIIANTNISNLKLNYLKGVTSDIQDQLNSKENKITGAISTLTSNNLTSNRVLVSDVDGKISTSINISNSELDSLHRISGNIQDQLSNIQSELQTKLNLSGGTLTGRLNLSSSGFQVASKDDITTRTDSGFFQTATATTGEGWPATTNAWYHLISSTHSNNTNYYAMQFAGDFYNSNNVYYRVTNGSGTAAWKTLYHTGNLPHPIAQLGYTPVSRGGDTMSGDLEIAKDAPTIYLRDSNQRSTMLHCNNDRFYVLCGAANSTTWDKNYSVNGRWPMELEFGGGVAKFAGHVELGYTTPTSDSHAASKAYVDLKGSSTGLVSYFARTSAPSGWMECNGATIANSGSTAALYSVLGTRFGGAGKLPDLRGKFIRSYGNYGTDNKSGAIGETQGDDFKSHRHSHYKTFIGAGSKKYTYSSIINFTYYMGGDFPTDTGYSGGTETRPVNMALLACIKL